MKLCAFADEASVDLQGQIEALKRNNISLLEIRGVDGENIKDISYNKIKEIKKSLDANGISVWSIGSPVGKNNPNDNFDAQLDTFKRLCEYAEILEATRIRMFSFYSKNEEEVFKRLEAFCDVAPKGIVMCHENEKGIFGDIPERCLEIHKAFPEIKGIFDPANYVQCGVNTRNGWELLKDYIYYLHIKDSLNDGFVVPAGEGDGNVEFIINDYISLGGKALTIEPHLTVFEGLKNLEREGEESAVDGFKYPDANTAFDVACNAVNRILRR